MKNSHENNPARISENLIIAAIRQGLLFILPLILVGSFILMILNLPIPAFQHFMDQLFQDNWRNLGLAIYKGTFEIMSLTAVMAISYAYCSKLEVVTSGKLNPFSIVLASLCSYFAFNPIGDTLIDANSANSRGMLPAIIIAILSTKIYVLIFNHFQGKRNVYSYDADSLLIYSFKNILPLLLTLSFFALVRILFNLSQINLLSESIMTWVEAAFQSSSGGLVTTFLFIFIVQLLWFFGMHGTNILDAVAHNLFVPSSNVNIDLYLAGEAPTQIITKEFFDNFVFIGGAGCTLGLLIALLIAGRSSNVNRVAKYSLLPGIFNINETMTYGLPIIFNPYYIIPFIMTPLVISFISYFAFWSGLVPLTIQRVEWTTPILLSGYVSTGSFAGVVLQLANLFVSVLIYLPFVRLYERQFTRKNEKTFRLLAEKFTNPGNMEHREELLKRNDEIGALTRVLVSELEQELKGSAKNLHLAYQPKILSENIVFGAEALLRWEHPVYGPLSPLLIVGLCEEAGLNDVLGTWVIDTACQQLAQWNEMGYQDLNLSINLPPTQVRDDKNLLENIKKILKKTGVDPTKVELELTEHAAIDQSFSTSQRLASIKQLGIKLSIDDFGMGNSSLLYIRDFFVDTVKLDISLVRSITINRQSQEIVRSIISLCEQLNISIIAEGIETKEQLDKLRSMGCHQYQGFLFGQALDSSAFINYLNQSKTALNF